MNSTPNGAAALEARLTGFGRLGLFKVAGALVTDNRPTALTVGLTIGELPIDPGLPDDLVAAGLDSLASLATVLAAELRGEQPLR